MFCEKIAQNEALLKLVFTQKKLLPGILRFWRQMVGKNIGLVHSGEF
jgi:hypothetical protein